MSMFDKIENWLDELIESWKTNFNEKRDWVKETSEFNDEISRKNGLKYSKKKMNNIDINGESFQISGNNVIIENDKVIVNGQTIKEGLKGIVKVEFNGDLANLNSNTVVVNGNVQNDVNCNIITITGDVNGDIDSNTVTINGNVEGDIDTNMIKCGDVNGDIDTTTITCKNHYGDIDM